jgi:hypothetical protein
MDDERSPDATASRPPEPAALGGDGTGPDPDPGTRPRHRLRWAVPAAAMLVVVALLALTDAPAGTVIGAVILGLAILGVGLFFLRQFATPPPPPPDPGTLRRVRLVYRCPVCGAEVRMTSAATEDPEPPRHCMEEMDLISTGLD